jgi:alanine-glyoxylate transaminase/serine-glyoxylate transaminase/serine-pyruvate transaminase
MEPFEPGRRILIGPGPSDVPERVLKAMAIPLVSHLDPAFWRLMGQITSLLRELFQTGNEVTFPVSGSGTAGMETCFANLLEPGDTAVIGVCGVFGARMAEMAKRCGARVVTVPGEWGEIVDPGAMARAIGSARPKIAAIVHAETSTGVHQPIPEIAAAAHDAGALLVLDCVTSLGGLPVAIDGWGVDAAFSGTQKCLSCPPGLSPVTFSDRAMDAARARRAPLPTFNLDLLPLAEYWCGSRAYHHTAPVSLNFALYEALRIVFEEGMEKRFLRHRRVHEMLQAGLSDLGLELSANPGHRLPMLNAVRIPDGVDDAAVRRALLEDHGIEIGSGLGPLKGKIWRVGLMGASATELHVSRFLAGIRMLLSR